MHACHPVPCRGLFKKMGLKIVLKKEEQYISGKGKRYRITGELFSQYSDLSFHNYWFYLSAKIGIFSSFKLFFFLQQLDLSFVEKDIDALGSGTRWQWVTGVIGARPPQ